MIKSKDTFITPAIDEAMANTYGHTSSEYEKARSLLLQACSLRSKNKCERCGIDLSEIDAIISPVIPATNYVFLIEPDWNNIQCRACWRKFGSELDNTRNKVAKEMLQQFGSTPTTYRQPYTITESDLLERIESYAKGTSAST
jgi:hypothetical protein